MTGHNAAPAHTVVSAQLLCRQESQLIPREPWDAPYNSYSFPVKQMARAGVSWERGVIYSLLYIHDMSDTNIYLAEQRRQLECTCGSLNGTFLYLNNCIH